MGRIEWFEKKERRAILFFFFKRRAENFPHFYSLLIIFANEIQEKSATFLIAMLFCSFSGGSVSLVSLYSQSTDSVVRFLIVIKSVSRSVVGVIKFSPPEVLDSKVLANSKLKKSAIKVHNTKPAKGAELFHVRIALQRIFVFVFFWWLSIACSVYDRKSNKNLF